MVHFRVNECRRIEDIEREMCLHVQQAMGFEECL